MVDLKRQFAHIGIWYSFPMEKEFVTDRVNFVIRLWKLRLTNFFIKFSLKIMIKNFKSEKLNFEFYYWL